MAVKNGKVSVTTENIFPIIRQWLYSDQDIFVRELISNCSDACAKHRRLVELGKAEEGLSASDVKYRIDVIYDDEAKTLAFKDNGIGMTGEEIDKYINQIAFSGALDFVNKYQEQSTDKSGIIGHFGLGFYSAFMVADEVTIDTKSFVEGEPATMWKSEDGMEYEISESSKSDRGTTITLKLSEEAQKLFDSYKLRGVIRKYCSFVPVELYFTDVVASKKQEEEDAKKKAEAEEKGEEYNSVITEEKPINDTNPLWTKSPKDCTDEEYKAFYHQVFQDMRDPLFWIHLNMDYPFTLQGILYFPQTDNVYQNLEGRIKIYNHQVFVADNIEEIIPDFLFLLRGCLDCSDLPLNVSRSALQQDEYVKKLSGHIIKKVSDKLNEIFKKDRASYEKYWAHISVFLKYGMMKEEKFYDKVKDICLFKSVDDKFFTMSELTAEKNNIRYTNDPTAQAAYIDMSKKDGYEVVILNEDIDSNLISFLEYKNQSIKFNRVDSQLSGTEGNSGIKDKLEKLFKAAVGEETVDVSVMALGEDGLPAFIRESEEDRRMAEMSKFYKELVPPTPIKKDLVINTDSPIILKLSELSSDENNSEKTNRLAEHVYDQALLAHGTLDSKGLSRFLAYNSELIKKSIENI